MFIFACLFVGAFLQYSYVVNWPHDYDSSCSSVEYVDEKVTAYELNQCALDDSTMVVSCSSSSYAYVAGTGCDANNTSGQDLVCQLYDTTYYMPECVNSLDTYVEQYDGFYFKKYAGAGCTGGMEVEMYLGNQTRLTECNDVLGVYSIFSCEEGSVNIETYSDSSCSTVQDSVMDYNDDSCNSFGSYYYNFKSFCQVEKGAFSLADLLENCPIEDLQDMMGESGGDDSDDSSTDGGVRRSKAKLRTFRNTQLMKTEGGRRMVNAYYTVGSYLVPVMRRSAMVKFVAKVLIYPILYISNYLL